MAVVTAVNTCFSKVQESSVFFGESLSSCVSILGEIKFKHLRDSEGVYQLLGSLVYHELQFSAFVIYLLCKGPIT